MIVALCLCGMQAVVCGALPITLDDLAWLEAQTRAVFEESRVPAGATVAGVGPNTTGYTVIRPGGRNAYPAFWIRDYAMSLDVAMVTPEEQRHMLFLTALHQVDEETRLPSGSVLPPGSVPDHVAFGDVPIYFPGVLEDYEQQGGPQWGLYPCLDDQFFFVHMAWVYARTVKASEFLRESVRGKPLLQRLEEACAMPPSRADSGLVFAEENARGVNFGFFDTVVHTGDLLFCSLLKFRALRELADLCNLLGDKEEARAHLEAAARLSEAITATFVTDSGWLRASTGTSAQPDVWGTAFAVYIGALPPQIEQTACETLARALREGTIAWQGGIRHVPVNADFSATTAWEKAYADKNRYQNGAYWHTPTGWVCYAAAKADFAAAQALAEAYLAHLREDDFRNGPEHGAPWECLHPEENHRQNPVYLTSVSCPLAAFRRMAGE